MKALENRECCSAGQHQGAAINKGDTESHAETRSSRRESNPPTSALSAAPREKNLETGSGNDFRFWMRQFYLPRTQSRAPDPICSPPMPSCDNRACRWVMATASIWSFIS